MVKLNSVIQNKLRTQTLEGLAKVFKELKFIAVAKEIKRGRDVVQNIEYGLNMLHNELGPTTNYLTGAFYPQTTKNKEIEDKFIKLINTALINGGYRKISHGLQTKFRHKDIAFEKRMRKRFGTKFHKVIE